MKKIRIIDSKLWTQDEIKNLLLTNDKAVKRGIIALYHKQEPDEKNSQETIHNNKAGFDALDAKFMSICAIKLIKNENLQNWELIKAKHRIIKYSKQLTNIANNKIIKEGSQLRWDI